MHVQAVQPNAWISYLITAAIVGLITDMLAALALGMFAMQPLEMYLRAKRLLAEAQAARA